MFSNKLTRSVTAGVAAVAVAIGGYAIGTSGSSNGASGTANAAPVAAQAQPTGSGQGPRSGQAPQAGQAQQTGKTPPPGRAPAFGQPPQGWQSGAGTLITGAAADKAKAAAVAADYAGTVNRVLQLSDGSYAVHFFATSGPHHVFVSKDFKVTAAQ